MRPLRHLVIGESGVALVEVTTRTVHGRFLLLPSTVANALIIGTLARAQERYGVEVCAFAFLSNHYHLILSVRSSRQLARFMRYVNSNIARKIGRLYGWREKFFSGRYHAIQISNEVEAQIDRLLYFLRQGCKEGLVRSPLEWPGVHCAWHLTRGIPTITGWWEDQTAEYRARLKGEKVKRGQFREDQTLHISPLPCWQHLSAEEVRDRVRELVLLVEDEVRHRGKPVLGVERVLKQHPHSTPAGSRRRPAPRFHAASRIVRNQLHSAYRQFVQAYREAADRLRDGDLSVLFPSDCFPPRLPVLEGLSPPT